MNLNSKKSQVPLRNNFKKESPRQSVKMPFQQAICCHSREKIQTTSTTQNEDCCKTFTEKKADLKRSSPVLDQQMRGEVRGNEFNQPHMVDER